MARGVLICHKKHKKLPEGNQESSPEMQRTRMNHVSRFFVLFVADEW